MHFQFTTLVKANNRIREFNFTRLSLTANDLFEVDVCDDKGNRVLFKMKKEGERSWRIINEQEVPQWVTEVEEELDTILQKELE